MGECIVVTDMEETGREEGRKDRTKSKHLLNLCCACLFESPCEPVSIEQILGVVKGRNSCSHKQSLSDEEGQTADIGV